MIARVACVEHPEVGSETVRRTVYVASVGVLGAWKMLLGAVGVENVPTYRVVLSKAASLMYRVILHWDIHTYTCMFRAYRRRVIETVGFESDGFLGVTELLANAVDAGYGVGELPCTLRARRYGQSKARVLQIIRSHLRFQWQLVGRRVALPRQLWATD